jgi:hypothetical protein
MRFLIIAGLVLAGLRAFIALKGATYRGRERRWSGSGGRWHL